MNTPTLTSLNDDIYRLILEKLPKKDSLTFSMTCHSLREALVPALFERLVVFVYGPWFWTEPERCFVPASLRPHIHSLILYDTCPDQLQQAAEDMYFTTDNRRCGVFPSVAVAARLRELPHLRSLTIREKNIATHGITWDTLLAVLSVPHVQEIKLIGTYICPFLLSESDVLVSTQPLQPIKTFHYQILDMPEGVGFEMEIAALAAILSELHEGLEMLTLRIESAPLSTLAQLHWPRLRKLTFYGTPRAVLSPAIAALLLVMPCLRDLSFRLHTTTAQTNMPQVYGDLRVLPSIVRLVLTTPNPRDCVFDHLPMTLRALSLRYSPHLHEQQFLHDIEFVYDRPRYDLLLCSTDVFSILRRCAHLDLDHLEVEYRADGQDDTLLQYIVDTFPNVTSLKIHRYRPALEEQEGITVPVRDLAERLAPLSKLQLLKLYLNFAEMPTPILTSLPRSGPFYKYDESQIERHWAVVQDAATIFAQILSHTLRVLQIRGADIMGPKWSNFQLNHGTVLCSEL